MSWITPDRWLERCGLSGNALGNPYAPRRADRALAAALVEDPRRLAVVTGPAGAGVSRLALEVSRRFPVVVYRDPVASPDPVHEVDVLEYRLARVRAGETPLVILDGPSTREALSPLRELVARRIHPRLRVIVPCRLDVARRLRRIAGGYPRRSMLVAELARTRSDPPWMPQLGADLITLAAAGRVPAAVLRSPARLLDAGVAAVAPTGEVVCLIDERNRSDLLVEHVLDGDHGRAHLARVLARHPALRPQVLETLLWFGDGSLSSLILVIAQLTADQLPDVDLLDQRGFNIEPEVLDALRARGEEALAAGGTDELMGTVEERLAMIAGHRGDVVGRTDYLTSALGRVLSPRRRARITAELAVATDDVDGVRRAAAQARIHSDAAGLTAILRHEAVLLRRHQRVREARQRFAEIAALEDGVGHIGPGAATRLEASTAAAGDGDAAASIELASVAAAASQVVGNLRLQTRALSHLARLYVIGGDHEAATSALTGALVLCEAARDRDGAGDCHRALGALASQRGAAAVAAAHYKAALEAFTASGRIPATPLANAAAEADTSGPAEMATPAPALRESALRLVVSQ